MKCSQADTLIQRTLDGRVSPTERARLDAHLGRCDACRATWDQYRRLGRSATDWARRPAFADDPGDAFTVRVMAQIASREASPVQFPSRAAVRAGLAALALTALSFWSGPLIFAHLPSVPILSAVPSPAAFTLGGIGRTLETTLQDALGAWQSQTSHPTALPGWVPGALAAALGLNGAFAWRARRRTQEAAAR